MHIALIHYQLARSGGMESYLADLARGFACAGDSVEVWTRKIDTEFAATLPAKAKQVPVPPLPRLARNRWFSHAVQRLHLPDRYDLVLSLARTTGQDAYVSGGTHRGFMQATGKHQTRKDRSEIRLERVAVEKSACVVAHSKKLKREYKQLYGADPARVHVLYPPVDVARFVRSSAAARKARREALGLRPKDFAFLFPSASHVRKGLPALLQAFKKFQAPQARLLIAGRAARVEDPRVRSLGYVTDMPGLYSAVDCTVLPSIYEPFGLVIAESLQCGTPVITAANSGVAELMQASDGLQLAACDAAAIVTALRAMLDWRDCPSTALALRHGLTVDRHVAELRRLCCR